METPNNRNSLDTSHTPPVQSTKETGGIFNFAKNHKKLSKFAAKTFQTITFQETEYQKQKENLSKDIYQSVQNMHLLNTITLLSKRLGEFLLDEKNGSLPSDLREVILPLKSSILATLELNLLHIFKTTLKNNPTKSGSELSSLLNALLAAVPSDKIDQLKAASAKIQEKKRKEETKEETVESKELATKKSKKTEKKKQKKEKEIKQAEPDDFAEAKEILREAINGILKSVFGENPEEQILLPFRGKSKIRPHIMELIQGRFVDLLVQQLPLLFPADVDKQTQELKEEIAKLTKRQGGSAQLLGDCADHLKDELIKKLPELFQKKSTWIADILQNQLLSSTESKVDPKWKLWLTGQLAAVVDPNSEVYSRLTKGIGDRLELALLEGIRRNLEDAKNASSPVATFADDFVCFLNQVLRKQLTDEQKSELKALQDLQEKERGSQADLKQALCERNTAIEQGQSINGDKIRELKQEIQKIQAQIAKKCTIDPSKKKAVQLQRKKIKELEEKIQLDPKNKNKETVKLRQELEIAQETLQELVADFEKSGKPPLYQAFYPDFALFLKKLHIQKQDFPLPDLLLDPVWDFLEAKGVPILIDTYADLTKGTRRLQELRTQYASKFPEGEGELAVATFEQFIQGNIDLVKQSIGIQKHKEGKIDLAEMQNGKEEEEEKPVRRIGKSKKEGEKGQKIFQMLAKNINRQLPKTSQIPDQEFGNILFTLFNDNETYPGIAQTVDWVEEQFKVLFYQLGIFLCDQRQDGGFSLKDANGIVQTLSYEFTNRLGDLLGGKDLDSFAKGITALQAALRRADDKSALSDSDVESDRKTIEELSPHIFPLIQEALHQLFPKESQDSANWMGVARTDLPVPDTLKKPLFRWLFDDILPRLVVKSIGSQLPQLAQTGKVFATLDANLKAAHKTLEQSLGKPTGQIFASTLSRYVLNKMHKMREANSPTENATLFKTLGDVVAKYQDFNGTVEKWPKYLDDFAALFETIPGEFGFLYQNVLKRVDFEKSKMAVLEELPQRSIDLKKQVMDKIQELDQVFAQLEKLVAAQTGYFESCVQKYRKEKGDERFDALSKVDATKEITTYFTSAKESIKAPLPLIQNGKKPLHFQLQTIKDTLDSVLFALPDGYDKTTPIAQEAKNAYAAKYAPIWQKLHAELKQQKNVGTWIQQANQQIEEARRELIKIAGAAQKTCTDKAKDNRYVKAILGQQEVLEALKVVDLYHTTKKMSALPSMDQARREFLMKIADTFISGSMQEVLQDILSIEGVSQDRLPVRMTMQALAEMKKQVKAYSQAKMQGIEKQWMQVQQEPVDSSKAQEYVSKILKIANIHKASDLESLIHTNGNTEQIWKILHGELAPQLLNTMLELVDEDLIESIYVSGLESYNNSRPTAFNKESICKDKSDPLHQQLDKLTGEVVAEIGKNLSLPLHLGKLLQNERMQHMMGHQMGATMHKYLGQKDFIKTAINVTLAGSDGKTGINETLRTEIAASSAKYSQTAKDALKEKEQKHLAREKQRKELFLQAGDTTMHRLWTRLHDKIHEKIEYIFGKFGAEVVYAIEKLVQWLFITPVYYTVVLPVRRLLEKTYYNKKMEQVEEQLYDVVSHTINKQMILNLIDAFADSVDEERKEAKKKV